MKKNVKRITCCFSLALLCTFGMIGCTETIVPAEAPFTEAENDQFYTEAFARKSTEQLLAEGWTQVATIQIPEQTPTSSERISGLRNKLSNQQMDQIYRSFAGQGELENMYKRNGVRPEGVAVNNWKTHGAYTPVVTNTYGWHAYLQTGKVTTEYKTREEGKWTTLAVRTFTNQTGQQDNATISYQEEHGHTSTWNVTSKLAVAVEGKVGIPLLAEGKVTVTVGLEAGGGGSESTIKRTTSSYEGTVPPRSRRTFIIRQKYLTSKLKYTIPIDVTGQVGLNFYERVDGHHFWSADASKLLSSMNKKQIGDITYIKASVIDVLSPPIEKL